MIETIICIRIPEASATLDEAMIQTNYKLKGEFKYDYPEHGHKWYERIRTPLYEKDGELYYFASILDWDSEDKIKAVSIGKIENKNNRNPEVILN